MKKLSILTAITAISCVTLIAACGKNKNYNDQFGRVPGQCSPQRGFDDRYDPRYNNGFDSRYNNGFDSRYGGGFGHRNDYYDPTCTGGIHRRPPTGGCGMHGQGYYPAQHYTYGGSWCMQAEFCFGTRGYCPRYGVDSGLGETEILLCNLNKAPHAACPQGLTCQQIGEGDTGICS